MYGYNATHHPNGIGTAVIGSVLSATYPALDPFIIHQYESDFDAFDAAGDWTNTATGSVTNAITAGDGGWLAMLNSAANNDLNSLQLKAATFAIVAGNEAWFKLRFKVSSATNSALTLGLIQTTTTPLTVTDGIYFSKPAASTTMSIKSAASSVIVTAGTTITLADNTFVNVGFHYDGNATINIFLNNNRIGGFTPGTSLPTAALNLTIAEANGTAAAITTTVDYILAATQRPSTAL